MSNHYETLGVETNAQTSEIKKAYFDLAKKYHPDSGDESTIKKFHEISEAYKVLSDSELKKAYDETLTLGLEKIKAAEAEIVSKNPVYPTIHVKKRDSYRDIELREFHKNRLRRAIWRVILFTFFHGVLGGFLALLLKGGFILGVLAGLMIGFSHSIRRNFDIQTFFNNDQKRKLFHTFVWLIFILGILYFLSLVLFEFLI